VVSSFFAKRRYFSMGRFAPNAAAALHTRQRATTEPMIYLTTF